MSPSLSPTRNTASHSRPFAACRDASVTPSTAGACWADARSSSSATRSTSVADRTRWPDRPPARRAPAASPSAPAPPPGRPAAPDSTRSPASTSRTASAERDVAHRPGRAAQQHQRVAHLLAGEEPLAATHQIPDPGVGERLLERLRLGVRPVQHRDPRARASRRRSSRPMRAATAAASASSSSYAVNADVADRPGAGRSAPAR